MRRKTYDDENCIFKYNNILLEKIPDNYLATFINFTHFMNFSNYLEMARIEAQSLITE